MCMCAKNKINNVIQLVLMINLILTCNKRLVLNLRKAKYEYELFIGIIII
jgi:hypothetical protein